MRYPWLCLLAVGLPLAALTPPLQRVATDAMPASVHGRFDHLTADVAGNRLFLAAESAHAVLVFNLRTGQYERAITGIGIPHAIFVRNDLHRIFVTDGGTGALRIYDSRNYRLLNSVPLKVDADSIGFDPISHDLYIDNGGGDAHQSFSMFSAVNTDSGAKAWELEIPGDTLEAMAVARNTPRIYVNNRARNLVTVVNRTTHKIEANWPVTMAKFNVAMALDEAHGRLFLGCRSGAIVVMDDHTGKELQSLPIPTGVDDLRFDSKRQELFAATGSGEGAITVYREESPDRYLNLGSVAAAPGSKNETTTADRLYTTIPPGSGHAGAVYVYRIE